MKSAYKCIWMLKWFKTEMGGKIEITGRIWSEILEIVEYWSTGVMERRNKNRGYQKLRVWQDAIDHLVVKEVNAVYGSS